jgi:hypothetical protein
LSHLVSAERKLVVVSIDHMSKLTPARIADLRAIGNPIFDELLDVLHDQTEEYDRWISELEGPTPRELLDRITKAIDSLGTARPAIHWVINHAPRFDAHDQMHAEIALEHVVEALKVLRGT